MRRNTRERIITILSKESDLEALEINKRLENIGIHITYDALAAHLKKMSNEGILLRNARGKPWNYYYKLNKLT